jgi:hypothetical protein
VVQSPAGLAPSAEATDDPVHRGGYLLRGRGVAVVSQWCLLSAATDAATKTATLTLMIIIINTAWLIADASLAPLLRDRQRSRIVNVTFARREALVGATALTVACQNIWPVSGPSASRGSSAGRTRVADAGAGWPCSGRPR